MGSSGGGVVGDGGGWWWWWWVELRWSFCEPGLVAVVCLVLGYVWDLERSSPHHLRSECFNSSASGGLDVCLVSCFLRFIIRFL